MKLRRIRLKVAMVSPPTQSGDEREPTVTVALGARFVRCSVQPVDHAGRFLVEGRVAEGLRELSPENLESGLRQGIEQSARQAGVRPQFVEGLMPLSELLALGEKMKITQSKAVLAWEQHAGAPHAVADLGDEGRTADASSCLERLSRESERPLAQPLEVLAKDVGRWRQLLDVCGQRLDEGGLVERVRRQRRVRNTILLGSVAAITGCVCWVAIDTYAARRRVAVTLQADDACAVTSLSTSDLAKASTELQRRAEERRAQCDALRATEEQALAEQRSREARARKEERARKVREDRCAELAAHVAGGELGAADASTAGEATELLRRVASGTLQASDLGPADPALPCTGTPAGPKLVEAWAAAALRSPKSWANVEDPSPGLSALLIRHAGELPDDAKFTLLARADEAARQALQIGAPARLGRAVRLCELKIGMGLPEGLSCSSLLAIARARADSFGR